MPMVEMSPRPAETVEQPRIVTSGNQKLSTWFTSAVLFSRCSNESCFKERKHPSPFVVQTRKTLSQIGDSLTFGPDSKLTWSRVKSLSWDYCSLWS